MARTKLNVNQLIQQAQRSYVTTLQSTSSTTFTSLTTPQSVTVTVGNSGIVLVSVSTNVGNTVVGNYSLAAYQASGANTVTATDDTGVYLRNNSAVAGGENTIGKVFMLTGLTPGSTVFTLLFKVNSGTGNFERREIWALAL